MNVYIIYKFTDNDEVEKQIKACKDDRRGKNINFFRFKQNCPQPHWHRLAKSKIKESNMVCYFYNPDNRKPEDLGNVAWELKMAEKYSKKVFIFNLGDSDTIEKTDGNQPIFGVDYSGELLNLSRYKVRKLSDAVKTILDEASWDVESAIINNDIEKTPEFYRNLVEEYRIMVNTSENLMSRRQHMSNLYTTLCSAMVAFIGASFEFGSLFTTACAMLLSGIIMIFLAVNWFNCLKSYDKNNEGKFAVLNSIEKVLPADMFDCEYRYNTKNGIKSYSKREQKLPVIFMVFGGVTILAACVLLALLAFSVL